MYINRLQAHYSPMWHFFINVSRSKINVGLFYLVSDKRKKRSLPFLSERQRRQDLAFLTLVMWED